MFFSQFAPSQTSRTSRIGVAATSLATLLLAAHASAQSGSVQFKVESFQEIPASSVTSEYPFFESLDLMPFYPTTPDTGNVDMLIVSRLDSVFIVDPDADNPEDTAYYKIIAEYDAYDKAADTMRESGLLAFTVKDEPFAAPSGDNIIGFIRQPGGQVPSRLTGDGSESPTASTGYLTGLQGDVYWDFKSQSRRGYMIASGALYDAASVHESYLSFITASNQVGFSGVSLPVSGSEELSWLASSPFVRPLRNRTGMVQNLYYGVIDRSDSIRSEDLGLDTAAPEDDLVPAGLGQPWEFRNQAYILRLLNVTDTDGDRVPDFLDLTNTLVEMPTIADWGASNNWFYAGMTDDWIYSTRTTEWDYSNKFGWNWPYQPAPRSNYWFYVHGEGMGWMWTSEQNFPVMYRHQDGAFLQWMSTSERTATYYNFSSHAFETTSF